MGAKQRNLTAVPWPTAKSWVGQCHKYCDMPWQGALLYSSHKAGELRLRVEALGYAEISLKPQVNNDSGNFTRCPNFSS